MPKHEGNHAGAAAPEVTRDEELGVTITKFSTGLRLEEWDNGKVIRVEPNSDRVEANSNRPDEYSQTWTDAAGTEHTLSVGENGVTSERTELADGAVYIERSDGTVTTTSPGDDHIYNEDANGNWTRTDADGSNEQPVVSPASPQKEPEVEVEFGPIEIVARVPADPEPAPAEAAGANEPGANEGAGGAGGAEGGDGHDEAAVGGGGAGGGRGSDEFEEDLD